MPPIIRSAQRRPRRQLCTFAHRLVPDLVLRNWAAVRPSFVDGTATDRLRSIWARLAEKLPPSERLDLARYISAEPLKLDTRDGFIVTFPPPQEPAEAAIAIVPDLLPSTHYFVVEYGFNPMSKQPYWVLCGWKLEGEVWSHLNMGAVGTEAEPDISKVIPEVVQRVLRVLEFEETEGDQSRN